MPIFIIMIQYFVMISTHILRQEKEIKIKKKKEQKMIIYSSLYSTLKIWDNAPPPGAQRYIIYKVLKFGVSCGGAPPPAPWVVFYFLKITLGTAVLAAGGICPSPCTTPAAWAGGRGGTVPVIIKHKFNLKKILR